MSTLGELGTQPTDLESRLKQLEKDLEWCKNMITNNLLTITSNQSAIAKIVNIDLSSKSSTSNSFDGSVRF